MALGRPPPPGDPGWGALLGVFPGGGFMANVNAATAPTPAAKCSGVCRGDTVVVLVVSSVFWVGNPKFIQGG